MNIRGAFAKQTDVRCQVVSDELLVVKLAVRLAFGGESWDVGRAHSV